MQVGESASRGGRHRGSARTASTYAALIMTVASRGELLTKAACSGTQGHALRALLQRHSGACAGLCEHRSARGLDIEVTGSAHDKARTAQQRRFVISLHRLHQYHAKRGECGTLKHNDVKVIFARAGRRADEPVAVLDNAHTLRGLALAHVEHVPHHVRTHAAHGDAERAIWHDAHY